MPTYIARDGARRHLWIVAGDDRTTLPWPGLLIQWERRDAGWCARVVFVPYPASVGELTEAWLPTQSIRPAPDPYRPKPNLGDR